jgi:hypothetical protein
MVLAAFVPLAPEWRLTAMIAPIMAASVVPVAYSWWLWRSRPVR